MEMFLPVLSLLLLNTFQYSSCERLNIVPSPDSPCPGEFTGEPCLTLQQYVANPSLSSNVTLEFCPGDHRLNSQLSVSNINTFTMIANASATVMCNQQLQLDEPFYFYQLQQVYVSGITFIGCRMELQYITNGTFERSSFVNRTTCCSIGAALYVWSSSVQFIQCIISNNTVFNGAIYGYRSNFLFEQTTFWNNYFPYSCCSDLHGGAIHSVNSGNIDIRNSNFSSNSASNGGHGGAIYTSNGVITITGTCFSDNRAGNTGGHGGAVYFDGGNITITTSTFINNTASAGGGGAIYSARRYTNISLVDNIFSLNTAVYCGVIDVDEFYHYHVNITGNTFSHNRAVGQVAGSNGGGVICIRNASIFVLDNNFSHNSAAGDAGVIQVDESNIIIDGSVFSNNHSRREWWSAAHICLSNQVLNY